MLSILKNMTKSRPYPDRIYSGVEEVDVKRAPWERAWFLKPRGYQRAFPCSNILPSSKLLLPVCLVLPMPIISGDLSTHCGEKACMDEIFRF